MNMAEVNLRELRTIVRQCLKEHKLKNEIQLKKVSSLGMVGITGAFARLVIIKNWNPIMDGHKWSSLVRMIRERTRKLYGELLNWTLLVEAK